MRNAILASVILGSMFTVAQAADVKVSGNVGVRNDTDKVGVLNTVRDRFRAQLKVTATPDDKTTIVAGLTTGSTKSTWNDMGGDNSLKTASLNLAYVEYAAAPFAKVTLGKMNRPWASSALFYDNDIKPEGVAVALKENNLGVFVNAFRLKLTEELTNQDSTMVGAQVGIAKEFAGAKLVASVAQLNQDYKLSQVPCVIPKSVPALPICSYEKRNLQSFNVGVAKDVAGLPVAAFYEQAKNEKAKTLNKATAYGVTIGQAKKAGSWEAGYINQKIEANSLSTVWTDSDFANATVGNKGYGLTATYAVTDSLKARATMYDSDVGVLKPVKYKRTLLDLIYTF
jgi:hypothetical protein